MAALGADANISLLGGGTKVVGPASVADTYFSGALLFALNVGTTGCVSCIPTSGTNERFLGISSKKQVLLQYETVEYYVGGVWLFPNFASIDKTKIGSMILVNKDGTATDNYADLILRTGDATGDCIVGIVVGLDASNNVILDMNASHFWTTTTTLAMQ